ncbi:MAG TPA: molecular chaperone [Rhodanobacteraceae bacterium]|nr:molecular chaperone [Rhodanobacteraceae bacterium]
MSRGLLTAAMAAIAGFAGASGLQVAPVGLEFRPSNSAQGLWLTNTGSEPLHAQVRVFHWTQVDGKDELSPTQALVASPPMLALAPGAQQMIRVIRLGSADNGNAEDAYRLLVDELPEPAAQQQTGVRYVLRYSVPVFVQPASMPDPAAIASALQWSLIRGGAVVTLQVHNSGVAHAQLSDVVLSPPAGAPTTVSTGLLGYVLPGMTMRWSLKISGAQLPPGTQLKAAINGKPVEQTLAVGDLPR